MAFRRRNVVDADGSIFDATVGAVPRDGVGLFRTADRCLGAALNAIAGADSDSQEAAYRIGDNGVLGQVGDSARPEPGDAVIRSIGSGHGRPTRRRFVRIPITVRQKDLILIVDGRLCQRLVAGGAVAVRNSVVGIGDGKRRLIHFTRGAASCDAEADDGHGQDDHGRTQIELLHWGISLSQFVSVANS